MAGGYTTEKSFYVAEGEEGELYVFLKAKNTTKPSCRVITTACFNAGGFVYSRLYMFPTPLLKQKSQN